MTNNQRELIAHMITLLDRGLESTGSYAEIFGIDDPSPDFETRMNEAAQELAEEFPFYEPCAPADEWIIEPGQPVRRK